MSHEDKARIAPVWAVLGRLMGDDFDLYEVSRKLREDNVGVFRATVELLPLRGFGRYATGYALGTWQTNYLLASEEGHVFLLPGLAVAPSSVLETISHELLSTGVHLYRDVDKMWLDYPQRGKKESAFLFLPVEVGLILQDPEERLCRAED